LLYHEGPPRQAFFVLTPTQLCYFPEEQDAAICPRGFLRGRTVGAHGTAAAGAVSPRSWGKAVAASAPVTASSLPLTSVVSAVATASHVAGARMPLVTVTAAAPFEDGSTALLLACANEEVAQGWASAITDQAADAAAVLVPQRSVAVLRRAGSEQLRLAAADAPIRPRPGAAGPATEAMVLRTRSHSSGMSLRFPQQNGNRGISGVFRAGTQSWADAATTAADGTAPQAPAAAVVLLASVPQTSVVASALQQHRAAMQRFAEEVAPPLLATLDSAWARSGDEPARLWAVIEQRYPGQTAAYMPAAGAESE
jgi:hypothetical protein